MASRSSRARCSSNCRPASVRLPGSRSRVWTDAGIHVTGPPRNCHVKKAPPTDRAARACLSPSSLQRMCRR
jgi:hypothetical protein